MHTKKATKYIEKKRMSYKLSQTPHTENNEESACAYLVNHPLSQPSVDFSPFWTPTIAEEIRKLQLRPVQIIMENCVFMLVPQREIVSLVMASLLIVL
jgi:hypothetical protein